MTIEKANKICNLVHNMEEIEEIIDSLGNILRNHSDADEIVLKSIKDSIFEIEDYHKELLQVLDEM